MAFIPRPKFAESELQAHADLDETFGEFWQHVATLSRPNRQAMPDPAKPAYVLTVKFTDEPYLANVGGEEVRIMSNMPRLTIHPCQLQRPVVRGDQFVRCSTGDRYEASSITKDTTRAVLVELIMLGVHE